MSKNFVETQVDFIKNVKVKDLKLNQKITLLGALLIFLGSFLPVLQLGFDSSSVISTSVVLNKYGSNVNLNTFFTGFLILLTSLITAYLALHPKNKLVAIVNTLSLGLYLYAFLSILSFANQFNTYQQQVQANILKAFYGADIAGTLSGLTDSYDINWLGWIVMIVGIGIVYYSVKSELLPAYHYVKARIGKITKKSDTAKSTDKENEESKKEEISKIESKTEVEDKDENATKPSDVDVVKAE